MTNVGHLTFVGIIASALDNVGVPKRKLYNAMKQHLVIALIGAIVLMTLFAITCFASNLSADARFNLLILQSLAAAATAGALSGEIKIEGKALGLTLKAAGAIAIGVSVFIAGFRIQQNAGRFAPTRSPDRESEATDTTINSPLIEGVAKGVDMVFGKVELKNAPLRGKAVINSPTVKDVNGSVQQKFGDVYVGSRSDGEDSGAERSKR